MDSQAFAYFIFGLTLVILFGIIIGFYYSKKRHKKVEEAKYKMLKDDED
ncbi:MAG: cbb3-type cytochrome c oxidase subunit 3 [Thermodesulfovibrionales bacterium]|nr:cbb3-type cytochrome c oxidase subunit 3 [Thermodesulfovibrionales bacterium]